MQLNGPSDLIDDRPAERVFRVHPDIFRSEAVFDLERKYLFARTWLYAAHESQLPAAHDFVLTSLNGQPVVVSRGGDGQLHCFLNACRHRGAMVCTKSAGNRKVHVCPYHAWSYDSTGRSVGITDRAKGAYPAAFDAESHNLHALPRVESYRGFIFASFAGDVPPLETHLGGVRDFLDLAADQGEFGMEVLPGEARYEYAGNWKLIGENSNDAYHFIPTHRSYTDILRNRRTAAGAGDLFNLNAIPQSRILENGHTAYWVEEIPDQRPLDLDRDALVRRVGDLKAKWMGFTRIALVYPNLVLLDAPVLQIRVVNPVAVDKTQITTHCLAPVGESAAARERRLRIYEEFFNPGGMATPDDLINLQYCQAGQKSDRVDWQQGYMRGNSEDLENTLPWRSAAPPSDGRLVAGDERVFRGPLRHWRDFIESNLRKAEGA